MSERKEKILSYIDRNGRGLEIGPSHSPIAPKKEGFNVEIIDHASADELRFKYKDQNVAAIEEVDHVWSGQSYAELTKKKDHYDWIIASHVIEHVPNLVSFINSCDEVLDDSGCLVLAVPDYRYCFDQFRALSSISEVVDSHLANCTLPTAGDVIDHMLNISKKGGNIAWGRANCDGENDFLFTVDKALASFKKRKQTSDYHDVHKWQFTPSSFDLVVNDIRRLGFISMSIRSISDTLGCEFFVVLQKNKGQPPLCYDESRRLELMERIQYEMAEPVIKRAKIQKRKKRQSIKKLFKFRRKAS